MGFCRRSFRDCVGCPCFLKSCVDVVVVDGVEVKVCKICCHSCVKGYEYLSKAVSDE